MNEMHATPLAQLTNLQVAAGDWIRRVVACCADVFRTVVANADAAAVTGGGAKVRKRNLTLYLRLIRNSCITVHMFTFQIFKSLPQLLVFIWDWLVLGRLGLVGSLER